MPQKPKLKPFDPKSLLETETVLSSRRGPTVFEDYPELKKDLEALLVELRKAYPKMFISCDRLFKTMSARHGFKVHTSTFRRHLQVHWPEDYDRFWAQSRGVSS